MLEQILSGFQAMSYWEYLAVLLGVAYLFLAMKQSLWCWPAAFVSTSIYTIMFWQGFLYMESLLNFYYLLMAIYGWWQWRGSSKSASGAEEESLVAKKIQSWSRSKHAIWISVAFVIAMVLGYLLDTHTDARMAYLDSFTTVFAIMTTYMVTQKVLENWLYWVVIDLASVYLYIQNQYMPTAVLFALYTVLAVQGYRIWLKEYRQAG